MLRLIDSFAQDTRYAFRLLRNSPTFTLVAILSLALGIGANTAIFSLLNAVLLRVLPVRDPAALVRLENRSWTNPIWEEIRDHQEAFEGVTAWGDTRLNLAQGGETRFVQGVLASGSFFDVLGVPAFVGRTFNTPDDRRGCGNGDVPAVLSGTESRLDARGYWWLDIVGRLKPGSTLEQTEVSLRSLQPAVREATLPSNWAEDHLQDYLSEPFSLTQIGTGVSELRNRYRQVLYVLMTVVAIVLLVACANLANLQLARAAARGKEIAVRGRLGHPGFASYANC